MQYGDLCPKILTQTKRFSPSPRVKFEKNNKTEVPAIVYSAQYLTKKKCKVMMSTNGNATDFIALCKFRQLASALCVCARLVPGVLGRGEQHVVVRHNSRPRERTSKETNVFIEGKKYIYGPNPVLLGWCACFPPRDRPRTEPQLPRRRLQLFQTSPLLSKWWNAKRCHNLFLYPFLPRHFPSSTPPQSPPEPSPHPSNPPSTPLCLPSKTWGPVAASSFINVYVFWSAGQKELACDP